MSPYKEVIDAVIAAEKGYVDHPDDRGGPTNWGITQAVARANGYTGHMRGLPEALAREIYERRYIREPKFDLIYEVSPKIGMELIDTGVNMGPAKPAEFLQRWLNGFNFDGSKYSDLFVDGRVGAVTASTLKAFLKWRGEKGTTALLRGLNSSQGERYLAIAEANVSQRKFLFGWTERLA